MRLAARLLLTLCNAGAGNRTALTPIAPYGVRLTALSGDKPYRRCSRARPLRGLPSASLFENFLKTGESTAILADRVLPTAKRLDNPAALLPSPCQAGPGVPVPASSGDKGGEAHGGNWGAQPHCQGAALGGGQDA